MSKSCAVKRVLVLTYAEIQRIRYHFPSREIGTLRLGSNAGLFIRLEGLFYLCLFVVFHFVAPDP